MKAHSGHPMHPPSSSSSVTLSIADHTLRREWRMHNVDVECLSLQWLFDTALILRRRRRYDANNDDDALAEAGNITTTQPLEKGSSSSSSSSFSHRLAPVIISDEATRELQRLVLRNHDEQQHSAAASLLVLRVNGVCLREVANTIMHSSTSPQHGGSSSSSTSRQQYDDRNKPNRHTTDINLANIPLSLVLAHVSSSLPSLKSLGAGSAAAPLVGSMVTVHAYLLSGFSPVRQKASKQQRSGNVVNGATSVAGTPTAPLRTATPQLRSLSTKATLVAVGNTIDADASIIDSSSITLHKGNEDVSESVAFYRRDHDAAMLRAHQFVAAELSPLKRRSDDDGPAVAVSTSTIDDGTMSDSREGAVKPPRSPLPMKRGDAASSAAKKSTTPQREQKRSPAPLRHASSSSSMIHRATGVVITVGSNSLHKTASSEVALLSVTVSHDDPQLAVDSEPTTSSSSPVVFTASDDKRRETMMSEEEDAVAPAAALLHGNSSDDEDDERTPLPRRSINNSGHYATSDVARRLSTLSDLSQAKKQFAPTSSYASVINHHDNNQQYQHSKPFVIDIASSHANNNKAANGGSGRLDFDDYNSYRVYRKSVEATEDAFREPREHAAQLRVPINQTSTTTAYHSQRSSASSTDRDNISSSGVHPSTTGRRGMLPVPSDDIQLFRGSTSQQQQQQQQQQVVTVVTKTVHLGEDEEADDDDAVSPPPRARRGGGAPWTDATTTPPASSRRFEGGDDAITPPQRYHNRVISVALD
ncbi:Hypothetical protein, putative [Bodo saltans]|uniref:Uncharacterized protein n=1 Tax=Bodo saltans TaxID=75058 RepID=A0A0S4IJV2_BODSA|nr:Hypothetical protein, putative [Bodo saltans]|eukprot:CUE55497.1 Hypothetical protein, putative [Bodo saltans]